jgi:hypothetical protein
MKTKDELIASLPERMRDMDFSEYVVHEDLDKANYDTFYLACRYQELLKAFTALIEKYS